MNILGIETSCDETAAAIVSDGGHKVRSSIVFSQTDFHRPYGGVVPEVASRNHIEYLPGIIESALAEAGLSTGGPRFAGALRRGESAGGGSGELKVMRQTSFQRTDWAFLIGWTAFFVAARVWNLADYAASLLMRSAL